VRGGKFAPAAPRIAAYGLAGINATAASVVNSRKADCGIGMSQISNRNVLSDMQIEIAAARRQYKSPGYRRRPDDFLADQPLDMLNHRVAVVNGFADGGISIGTEHNGIWAVDANEAQLA
jgi:hypothetical protein